MGTTDNSYRLTLQKSLKEIENLMSRKQYNITMIKARQILESMVNFLGEKALIIEGDLADSIDQLYEARLISQATKDHYHRIRMIGNKAVHEGDDSPYDAKEAYQLLSQEVHTFASSFLNKTHHPAPLKTESINSRNAARSNTARNRNAGSATRRPGAQAGRSGSNVQRPPRKNVSRNSQRSYSHKRSRRRPKKNGFQLNDLLKPALIFLVIFVIALIVVKLVPGKDDKKAATDTETSTQITTTESIKSTEEETLPPETEAQTQVHKNYTTKSKLNVRSEPSTNGTLLGTLASGTVVDYVNTYDDKWTVIMFEGEKAYVAAEYLIETEAETEDSQQ